ncbi:7469_t:CDS:2, partial [Entrophospora sp. SA101]
KVNKGNDENKENESMIMKKDREEFKREFKAMKDEEKWVLSTGKVVEDRLYAFDPEDIIYLKNSIFTKEELTEIILEYLNSFRTNNTKDLRKNIFKKELWDDSYDIKKYIDVDWVRNSVYNLLLEYENNSLDKHHLEMWYNLHVWSMMDKAFENLENVEAVRVVPATSSLKRKILGSRCDLIVRRGFLEFVCSEVEKFYEGPKGTKLLKESSLKIPKVLKDMLYDLHQHVNFDEDSLRKMETIGFAHAGLKVIMLRLDSPTGYVCRVLRTNMFEIPSNIKEFGSKALNVLVMALKAKLIVQKNIELLEHQGSKEAEKQLLDLQECCKTTTSTTNLFFKLPLTLSKNYP